MKRYGPALLCLLLTACGGSRNRIDPAAAAAGGTGAEHELHLAPAQVEAWGIRSEEVRTTDIAAVITLPGTIELDQSRTALVSPLIGGQVARIGADPGDRVRPGQVLLTLTSPQFARAQADWLEALARFRLSRTEADRARSLFADRAIEERELLRREADAEQQAVALGAAEAVLLACGIDRGGIEALRERYDTLLRTGERSEPVADPMLPILAPRAGRVIDRDAVRGEQVGPERILFTIADLSVLWAELDAYEQHLPFLDPRSEVTITTDLYPGREFPARIIWISDVLDEALRTVTVRVEVANSDRLLRPNLFVSGVIVKREPGADRLAVPENAIVDLHGEKSVFVLIDAHQHEVPAAGSEAAGEQEGEHDHVVYAVRHIEIGESVGDLRIVTTGLEEGERIVTAGAFTLKAELQKGSAGHGHVH